MARRSAADKAETHAEILWQASHSFRAHGSSVGIGQVMKDLGLTRGGFYRHFKSKDDLFVEALVVSFQDIGDKLERAAQTAKKGRELEAIITAYLSSEHLQHPETWCVLASLAPDIARQSLTVRKRIDGSSKHYMERMAKYLPGANAEEKRKTFLILFSGMAGAIALLRSLGDIGMRDQVLKLTRDYYLSTFAAPTR